MFEILFFAWIAYLVFSGKGRKGPKGKLPWLMTSKDREELKRMKEKEERDFEKWIRKLD